MAAVMCTVIYEFDVLELDEVEWDSNEYDDIIEDVKADWGGGTIETLAILKAGANL